MGIPELIIAGIFGAGIWSFAGKMYDRYAKKKDDEAENKKKKSEALEDKRKETALAEISDRAQMVRELREREKELEANIAKLIDEKIAEVERRAELKDKLRAADLLVIDREEQLTNARAEAAMWKQRYEDSEGRWKQFTDTVGD